LIPSSIILIDYAPYGNFSNLITSKHLLLDEKLVRTFSSAG